MQNNILLCLDVGGTKLEYRCVEMTPARRSCLAEGRVLCSEFADFYGAIHWLFQQISLPVTQVCIAAAGPVHGDALSFTNLDWRIDAGKIQKDFGLEKVVLVNDLTAVIWSLQSLPASDFVALKEGHVQGDRVLVVAPGTGLGVGIGVRTESGLVCIPSEGGHVSFSPRTRAERELLAFLSIENHHVSVESVCSGLGLGALFRFVTKENPCEEKLDHHALGPWLSLQVAENGAYGPAVLQTYNLFFDVMAEVCGNLAVTCLPGAGIFLAGGLMPKLSAFMDRERFTRRFLDRSVQKEVLETIPISEISNPNPALIGCENLLLG